MAEADLEPRRQLFDVSSRISRIEKRMNSAGDELQIVRSDTIDKHKEVLNQIGSLKAEISRLANEVVEAKKLVERTTRLLGEFASKESIKVLEKYINMWRPMEYVTRQEVEALLAKVGAKPVKAKKKPATKKAKPRKKKEPAHYSYTL